MIVASLAFSIFPLSSCCNYEINPSRMTFLIRSNCESYKLIAFFNFKFLRRVLCKHIWIQVNFMTVFFSKIYSSLTNFINHIDLFQSKVYKNTFCSAFLFTNQNLSLVWVKKFYSISLSQFFVTFNLNVVSILAMEQLINLFLRFWIDHLIVDQFIFWWTF
jgi:hypothetical protein